MRNRGYDGGYGRNAGVLWQETDLTRFGLAYRSKVDHKVRGRSSVSGIASDSISQDQAGFFGLRESNLAVDISLPEVVTLSAEHETRHRWRSKADISFVHWSRVRDLTLRFSGNPTHLNPNYNHLPTHVTTLHYRNTWCLLWVKVIRRTNIGYCVVVLLLTNRRCMRNFEQHGSRMVIAIGLLLVLIYMLMITFL